MANEIIFSFSPGKNCYCFVTNKTGQFWRTDTNVFENYNAANISSYSISAVQQGGSTFYEATFPPLIPAGDYSVVAKQQISGGVAESDPTVAVGSEPWNGTGLAQISDLATSGQVGLFAPIRLARGMMVQNFTFKLVSSIDHVSNFTSGVVSGQISRDGGAFAALQSGLFSEIGLGWYRTNLTSGDLLCNTGSLVFTANGISGGVADQRDFGLILQKVSGSM